jgi:hypothetical protein
MEESYEFDENSYVSETETEVIWSNAKPDKVKRDLYYIKRDPSSIKIIMKIPDDRKDHYEEGKTHATVQVYETNTTPGFRIRNAITGMYYPNYKVGSLDENRFYKVCWATGHEGRKEPLILFFAGPDEYEKHMFQTIDIQHKTEWRMRQIEQYRKDKRFKDVDDDTTIMQTISNESRRVVIIK